VRVVSLICGSVLVVYSLAGVRLDAGQPKVKPPPPPPKPAKPQAGPKQGNKQAAKQVPAEQLQKLLNMSPEEREKNLSKLPPAQRQNLENRLNNLDKLSPDQRSKRLDQISRLEKLPPARRQAVNQEIQRIQQLPPGPARRAAIHSPEFQQSYSPEEQDLIRERFPGAAK
jgi:hypothetical protein